MTESAQEEQKRACILCWCAGEDREATVFVDPGWYCADHDPRKPALAKQAYEAYIKRVDKHWKTNHPSWERLNSHAQKTWIEAAEVFKELLT
jgi:hypothetical protein